MNLPSELIRETVSRRGARMATLPVDPPDILEFIESQRDERANQNFNAIVEIAGRPGETGLLILNANNQADLPLELGDFKSTNLWCYVCHAVSDHDLLSLSLRLPVWVVMGTEDATPDRREWVESFIGLSHNRYPGADCTRVRTNDISRMPDFSKLRTIRQKNDLVTALEVLHR